MVLAAAPALAASPPTGVAAPEPGDMTLGSAKARVTVIEYASVGCPHCAVWNRDVFPTLRAKYIDTGKVRFVMREMITGDPTLATAGFMLARCAGPAKYFQVVDQVYRRQPEIYAKAGAAGEVLEDIAKQAGMDEAAFQACISDQKGLDALNARVKQHDQDHVDSTPTFFVNGKLYPQLPVDGLDAAIRGGHR
ncbi:MAG TPA: DsbA family protein [Caulobacteraceae bacterium]|nr:DsbA family protein [Caulobacteraceae bacterium]